MRHQVNTSDQVSGQVLCSNNFVTTPHSIPTPNICGSVITPHIPPMVNLVSTPSSYTGNSHHSFIGPNSVTPIQSSSVVPSTITNHLLIGSNCTTPIQPVVTSPTTSHGIGTGVTTVIPPWYSIPSVHPTTSWPVSATGMSGGTVDNLSLALLSQQIPSLPKFSGDTLEGDAESFTDWIEQLELIAEACRWNSQSKLVNLVTRLRGQAYSFYRSCTADQRANYDTLVAALKERFTPIQIQSVQSSKFHERKQLPAETVDSYAQDLKKLYYRAYAGAQRGSKEAEAMGRSVLAYQFVAGLLPHLKSKLVGCDGRLEELLMKARFEEARYRDVVAPTSKQSPISGKAQAGHNTPREPPPPPTEASI